MGQGQSTIEGTVAPGIFGQILSSSFCSGYESVREKFEENFRTGRETRWMNLNVLICEFQRSALCLCWGEEGRGSVGFNQGQRFFRRLHHQCFQLNKGGERENFLRLS